MTGSGFENPHFKTTRWSLVVAASGNGPAAEEALADLCQVYYRPLYAYARSRRLNPFDAEDALQGFFEFLLTQRLWEKADRQRGRLRAFFLTCFKNYLASQIDKAMTVKRGGGVPVVYIDHVQAESSISHELIDHDTPETIYSRCWATTLLEHAVEDVQLQWSNEGRENVFRALKNYITGELDAPASETLGAQLRMTAANIRTSATRLRRQFKDAVLARIAETICHPTAEELELELKELLCVLSSPRSVP